MKPIARTLTGLPLAGPRRCPRFAPRTPSPGPAPGRAASNRQNAAEPRRARGARRPGQARSRRLPVELVERHRLHGLAFTGEHAAMVVDLTQVIGEMRRE